MMADVPLSVRVATAADTERFGEWFGTRIPDGCCVVISGPLGAGKTTLVRGICRGLGVLDPVTSPTYILCDIFQGRCEVAHVDLYRLEHESEIEALGVFDMVGTAVILAEWGERSPGLLEESDVVIHLDPTPGRARNITLKCKAVVAESLEGIDEWS